VHAGFSERAAVSEQPMVRSKCAGYVLALL